MEDREALMNAVDRQIRADMDKAKIAILREADPANGPICCNCGKPARSSNEGRTAYDLKKKARGDLSSGVMGLAVYELIEERKLIRDRKTMKLKLPEYIYPPED